MVRVFNIELVVNGKTLTEQAKIVNKFDNDVKAFFNDYVSKLGQELGLTDSHLNIVYYSKVK